MVWSVAVHPRQELANRGDGERAAEASPWQESHFNRRKASRTRLKISSAVPSPSMLASFPCRL